MNTAIVVFAFLLVGCAWTNNNRPAPPQPQPTEQSTAEQERRQALFQIVLGGLSRRSAAQAQLARDAAARPSQPQRDPARFVCRPRGPYTDEVECRER